MKTVKATKKGFTLVELVIVIAVIAILAAVLIPTFANVVKQANLSSDQVAARSMNNALSIDEVSNGKPANAAAMRKILKDAGFADKLSPVTSGYRFYWDSQENLVMLVETSTSTVVFPDNVTYVAADARYIPLDGIPEARVTAIPSSEFYVEMHNTSGTSLGYLTLDTGVKYECVDNQAALDESPYKDYYADFRVTFSKPLTYKGEATITDGMVGFMLLGSYDSSAIGGTYGTYKWVPLPVTGASGEMASGKNYVYVMKDLMNQGFKYYEVVNQVGTFECGIKAVYDNNYSSTFTNFDSQTMDDADKQFLNGLTVTVELVLFGGKSNSEYTGEAIVVDTYTYTYSIN